MVKKFFENWDYSSRRSIDIVFALAGMAVCAVPMMYTAAHIRLEIGSPVLFRQQRKGLGERLFTLYKFRTLKNETAGADGRPLSDLERVASPSSAKRRQRRIDELPQLWNLLKGDVSLIGPRPIIYESDIPDFKKRYGKKTGITGWAQIHQWAQPDLSKKENLEMDLKRKLALDLYYIENRSLGLDLFILYQTARLFAQRNKPVPKQPAPGRARQSQVVVEADC